MPYRGQQAGKGGHSDIVRNPDVAAFLKQCEFIREPSNEEAKIVAGSYLPAPGGQHPLPVKIAASDASSYNEPVNDSFPSIRVGYVKVSVVLIDMGRFKALSAPNSRYVDPFAVAEMHRSADGVAFALPSSNIRFGGEQTVRNAFRRAVFEQLSDARTNFDPKGNYRVIDTLILLAHQKGLEKCPCCEEKLDSNLHFSAQALTQPCPKCGAALYATDLLSIHEEMSDFGENGTVIGRFMNLTEHLMMASLIRMLADRLPSTLAKMGFIVDGPLALFGRPAWLHGPLMALYHDIEQGLAAKGLPPPIIMGLQKDGQVMEHARSIGRHLGKDTYRVVDDDYRDKWITGAVSQAATHGHETYYGQDFILKTDKGGVFCIGLPYPLREKGNPTQFRDQKVEIARYGDRIGRAFDVVREFEFDLYENSIIPVALAHRHASISLVPGGKVLDLITRAGLGM